MSEEYELISDEREWSDAARRMENDNVPDTIWGSKVLKDARSSRSRLMMQEYDENN